MRNRLRLILSGLALFGAVLLGTVPAFAQTTTTSTTLSAQLNPSDRFATLASTTNVAVGGLLYVDREALDVLAVNTTTGVVNITRGFHGTTNFQTDTAFHASGATVYVASPSTISNIFRAYNKIGGCVAGNEAFLPQINVDTGEKQTCTNSAWTAPSIFNTNLAIPVNAGGMPILADCGAQTGATSTCSNTNANNTAIIYYGASTLSSNAQVVTFSPGYTSTTSYRCVANDVTTRANPVQMVPTSATTATITNTTGAADVISWVCTGR